MSSQFTHQHVSRAMPLSNIVAYPRTIAWGIVLVGLARIAWIVPTAPYYLDFSHYYLAGRIALEGNSPYTTPLQPLCTEYGLEFHPLIPYGAHPPLLIHLFMGLAWLPLKGAYGIWLGVQCLSLAAMIFLTSRLLALRWDEPWHIGWIGLFLNSNAVLHHFEYSQVQLLIGAALAAATWLVCRGRCTAAVGLVTAAAAFKLYPAVLLPWFLLTKLKDWRDLARRSLTVGAVAALALVVTGTEMWRDFFALGMPVIEQSIGRFVTNYTISSAVVTLHNMTRDVAFGPAAGPEILWFGKTLSAAVLAAAYWVVWRRRIETVAAVGLLMVAMLLAGVVCWSHYFVLLLPALTRLVVDAWNCRAGTMGWRRWAPVLFVLILLMPKTGGTPPTGVGVWDRLALHFYLFLHLYPLVAMGAVAKYLADYGREPRRTGTSIDGTFVDEHSLAAAQ